MKLPVDKKFRLPRIWSNDELKKFAHLIEGSIVNVSGWKDQDKEGMKYKDYFKNSKSYTITNFKAKARGFQGKEGEIFLDLEKELPQDLVERFDTVFNHTTLEHIYEFRKAFENLCKMSKDLVIIVVPFLQEMHGDYGDYWRFTPSSIEKLFNENNMETIYLNFNDHKNAGTYVFAIASKNADKWKEIKKENSKAKNYEKEVVGLNAMKNNLAFKISNAIKHILKIKDY